MEGVCPEQPAAHAAPSTGCGASAGGDGRAGAGAGRVQQEPVLVMQHQLALAASPLADCRVKKGQV